jgi:hypothetical protein
LSAGVIKLSADVSISISDYASQGNGILGIRDSGKSYTATFMAEQLIDAGVSIIAFDPIGVWRYLKVPGKGKGFEVVVAGEDADLPLTPKSAPEIVRAAMRENINLVLDLYQMGLSKADWRTIVRDALRILLYENKRFGPRHVFIEEAAEFAPQKVGSESGAVYAEVEKLARMGGNASLGYTLINQRAEEVNKAVLELCDCLFIHRQKGRNSLTALEKWLSFADAEGSGKSREIVKSLPMLEQGECWVWLPGSDAPKRVKMPQKQSLHPDRRKPEVAAAAKKKAIDVGTFVDRLKASLPKHEEPKPKTTHALAPTARIETKVIEVEKPILTITEKHALEEIQTNLANANERLDEIAMLRAEIGLIRSNVADILKLVSAKLPAPPMPPVMERTINWKADKAARDTLQPAAGNNSEVSSGGRKRMLTALAQRPQGLNHTQLAIRTGMSSKGGTFQKYLGELRTAGWVEGGRDRLCITQEGLKALGSFQPLPMGKALLDHWVAELGGGKARILEVLAHNYPNELSAEQVSAETGMTMTGGTFQKYLGELKTLELITGNRARLRASGEFFE